MNSILLVDGEQAVSSAFQRTLRRFGYQVEVETDADEAFKRARDSTFDLILVEMRLGRESGTALVRQLRAAGFVGPILVHTSLSDPIYETSALDAGADDYISKSVSSELLASRIHAHLRREQRLRDGRMKGSARRIQVGDLMLDKESKMILAGETIVELTEKETKILALLASNSDRVVPSKEILEKAWGRDLNITASALYGVLNRLRSKLETRCHTKNLIENYHGRGFKLAPPQTPNSMP
jgi:DNA-binding response OmpR family regulator